MTNKDKDLRFLLLLIVSVGIACVVAFYTIIVPQILFTCRV